MTDVRPDIEKNGVCVTISEASNAHSRVVDVTILAFPTQVALANLQSGACVLLLPQIRVRSPECDGFVITTNSPVVLMADLFAGVDGGDRHAFVVELMGIGRLTVHIPHPQLQERATNDYAPNQFDTAKSEVDLMVDAVGELALEVDAKLGDDHHSIASNVSGAWSKWHADKLTKFATRRKPGSGWAQKTCVDFAFAVYTRMGRPTQTMVRLPVFLSMKIPLPPHTTANVYDKRWAVLEHRASEDVASVLAAAGRAHQHPDPIVVAAYALSFGSIFSVYRTDKDALDHNVEQYGDIRQTVSTYAYAPSGDCEDMTIRFITAFREFRKMKPDHPLSSYVCIAADARVGKGGRTAHWLPVLVHPRRMNQWLGSAVFHTPPNIHTAPRVMVMEQTSPTIPLWLPTRIADMGDTERVARVVQSAITTTYDDNELGWYKWFTTFSCTDIYDKTQMGPVFVLSLGKTQIGLPELVGDKSAAIRARQYNRPMSPEVYERAVKHVSLLFPGSSNPWPGDVEWGETDSCPSPDQPSVVTYTTHEPRECDSSCQVVCGNGATWYRSVFNAPPPPSYALTVATKTEDRPEDDGLGILGYCNIS